MSGKTFQIQLTVKFSVNTANVLTETVLALNRNKTRPRQRNFPSPRTTGKLRFTFNQPPSAIAQAPPTFEQPVPTAAPPPRAAGKSGFTVEKLPVTSGKSPPTVRKRPQTLRESPTTAHAPPEAGGKRARHRHEMTTTGRKSMLYTANAESHGGKVTGWPRPQLFQSSPPKQNPKPQGFPTTALASGYIA